MKFDICIIGGGAAGLMASVFAARSGAAVAVIERNTSVGRKLLLTGGGRCNITHDGNIDHFVKAFDFCGRFLKHSLYEFSPADTLEFFASLGIMSRTEDDGSIFPSNDKAASVKNALLEEAQRLGVKFIYGRRVENVVKDDRGFTIAAEPDTIKSRSVIIATGGKSYPALGSTGDGYKLAERLGHNIIKPIPALAGLVTADKCLTKLQGIALANVRVSAKVSGKKVASTGAMMFTAKGIGGPAVFQFSRFIAEDLTNIKAPLEITIDLIADQSEEDFRCALSETINANQKKKVLSYLSNFLPARLAEYLASRADIPEETPFAQLTKKQREKLIEMTKRLTILITGSAGISQATITRGGIDTKQIDPKTMQSKIIPGLFFAGEVINADGPCGGYNLQIAWSTAVLAGENAAGYISA
ncbi:MAG: NAD(P)/FAD-dependent oxidoreductase [Phycisphaerae bacterium]|nr:NAD(P)/FAD-dependent oxidoreductase [Phycisphaerae bacterium]